jgi:hypothetical protein
MKVLGPGYLTIGIMPGGPGGPMPCIGGGIGGGPSCAGASAAAAVLAFLLEGSSSAGHLHVTWDC